MDPLWFMLHMHTASDQLKVCGELTGVIRPQAKGSLRLPEARREAWNGAFPRASERAWPYQHLDCSPMVDLLPQTTH